MRATYSVLISLDLPGQVLDIVKSLTSELRLSSLNNILTSVVEETVFEIVLPRPSSRAPARSLFLQRRRPVCQ